MERRWSGDIQYRMVGYRQGHPVREECAEDPPVCDRQGRGEHRGVRLAPVHRRECTGAIAGGHVRWGAANKLKLEKVPVHVASDLTDAQIKAYRLMDNRSNEETDWDFDLLGPELADLKMSDFDLALTGFDPNEIDAFLLGPVDEHADDVPPVPLVPVSRLGDIWLCGPHRVICGDCTSPDVIARLQIGRAHV